MLSNIKGRVKRAGMTSGLGSSFLQEAAMEAHLLRVRGERTCNPRARARERRLRSARDVKLHFGCGPRILPGWVNIDGWKADGIDFVMDLRTRLPFENDACRYIFSEHVIEHITLEKRAYVLREFARVLAPGGVLRLSTPDLRQFVAAYDRKDMGWFELVGNAAANPAGGLNRIITGHTHRFIDDFESLASELRLAGFQDVEESKLNGSSHAELRIDRTDPSRANGSLFIEARM